MVGTVGLGVVQEVVGPFAVPSGAEADESLQTRKRMTRLSAGTR